MDRFNNRSKGNNENSADLCEHDNSSSQDSTEDEELLSLRPHQGSTYTITKDGYGRKRHRSINEELTQNFLHEQRMKAGDAFTVNTLLILVTRK